MQVHFVLTKYISWWHHNFKFFEHYHNFCKLLWVDIIIFTIWKILQQTVKTNYVMQRQKLSKTELSHGKGKYFLHKTNIIQSKWGYLFWVTVSAKNVRMCNANVQKYALLCNRIKKLFISGGEICKQYVKPFKAHKKVHMGQKHLGISIQINANIFFF